MAGEFTYRFFHQCKPKDPHSEVECEDIVLTVKDLPFFPQIGMVLLLTDHMDYAEVDQVFWSFDKPGLIDVYLKEGKFFADFDKMAQCGWKVASDVS